MPLINRLAIIGVGLIGGSLARVLRDKGEVGEIVGIGRGEANLRKAVELGVIDRYATTRAQGWRVRTLSSSLRRSAPLRHWLHKSPLFLLPAAS